MQKILTCWQHCEESKRRDNKRPHKGIWRKEAISFSVNKQMFNCLQCVMKLGSYRRHCTEIPNLGAYQSSKNISGMKSYINEKDMNQQEATCQLTNLIPIHGPVLLQPRAGMEGNVESEKITTIVAVTSTARPTFF